MKLKNKIVLLLMLALSQGAYAFDMTDIVAYPVPFNPQKKTLTIGYPVGSPLTFTSKTIRVSIYDINGDLVIERSRSANPLIWNGRNSSGRFVKPGLYILKIEIDDDNGDYGKKMIRILVDY